MEDEECKDDCPGWPICGAMEISMREGSGPFNQTESSTAWESERIPDEWERRGWAELEYNIILNK